MKVSSSRKLAGAISLLCLTTVSVLPLASAQIVTTIAGGFVGDGRGATKASFQAPQAVVLDRHHNAYITDIYVHRIRKITPDGTITTYAGNGIAGFSGDGGKADSAMINVPTGITLDPAGNLHAKRVPLAAGENHLGIDESRPAFRHIILSGQFRQSHSGDQVCLRY